MHLDTDKNNENNIVFELKFLSTNVSSWAVHQLNIMLALLETRNVLPRDTSILKLNTDNWKNFKTRRILFPSERWKNFKTTKAKPEGRTCGND